TAEQMERMGYVNVTSVDSTIRVSLMYARPDNFTGKTLYTDLLEAYLHPTAAKALARAQSLLRQRRSDLCLIVYDAARPMKIQKKMWDAVKNTPMKPYVCNPANGGGLHNYGMAVDVTLCNRQTGDTLNMGTAIDHLGRYAHITEEDALVRQGVLTPQAKRNRELLRSVMREAGFKPLNTEWWHFNFITRAEARRRYKPIP
ncbi:MAG: M15 family metallopeptidase, partial [Bacteroidaceae bacterium]|nr:M15 family metallopeptidase [Bacteroidaceae bacterium]